MSDTHNTIARKAALEAGQPAFSHSRASKAARAFVYAGLLGTGVFLNAQTPAAPAAAADTKKTGDEVVVLDRLVVSKAAEDEFSASLAKLKSVPGANRLIDNEYTLRGNPALSQKAIFDFQPGVYAQGSGTSESVKISIRGSGLAGAVTYNRSINLLFDGLTFAGFAMSGHAVALNETLGLDHTEVLIGSNGFDFQSIGLGGAINYVSKTGYTADAFQTRIDTGSFGYISAQISTGKVVGKGDYYASLVASHSKGFQTQSAKDAIRLISNFGYKINSNVDTRFFVRYVPYIKNEGPGNLTINQVFADRKQANAINLLTNSFQETKNGFWLGSKTTFKIDSDTQLVVGGSFDNVPFTINNRGAVTDNQLETIYDQSNLTYLLNYETKGQLFGLPSSTKVGFRGLQVLLGNSDSTNYSNYAPKISTYGTVVRGRDTDGTANQILSVSNDLSLTKQLVLRTGVSGIHTRTVNRVAVADPLWSSGAIDNSKAVSDEDGYNWIVGLSYNLNPDVQVFANASRSVEQPTGLTKSNPINNSTSKDLLNQIGITEEIGIRGRASIFDGSLSVYRTDLKNEFLTQLVTQTISDTVNSSSPTIHQGVEAALTTTLWQQGGARNGSNASRVTLRQSYTFNDFYFDNHPIYGDNEIPSISRHIYQAELRYTGASGFYAAANTRASSSYDAEYHNYSSYIVPGYAIYGALVGYEAPKGKWNVYVSLNNITDKIYIVSTRPTAATLANIDNGRINQPLHSVGDPFSVYTGVGFRF